MHEAVTAEHGIEGLRRVRQGLCVASLKMTTRDQIASEFDRLWRKVESKGFRASL